jgi:hypothetical protein
MAHIWKSLVTDSKTTIDENFDLIIDDLLMQCGSRLWRSREASCLALADIFQGRKFDQVRRFLSNFILVCFILFYFFLVNCKLKFDSITYKSLLSFLSRSILNYVGFIKIHILSTHDYKLHCNIVFEEVIVSPIMSL